MPSQRVVRHRVVRDSAVLAPGWEMVGRYMYHFGQLELALADTICVILGLNPDAARLLLPRLYFLPKIEIITAAIPLQEKDNAWQSKAKSIVNSCRKFNDDRNMFCHGAFSVDEAGQVTFDYLNVKGEKPPISTWSDDNFKKKCDELARLERKVSNLCPGFRPVTYALRANDMPLSVTSSVAATAERIRGGKVVP
jgi:hypothetical protein